MLKNKLFWFVSYEGLRDVLGDAFAPTIPSDIALGNPVTSMVDACNAEGRAKVNPLSAQLAGLPAGSCIPQPASSTFENLFPYNPTNSNLFDPPITSSGPLNNGIIKGDYIPGSHHHISGMYFMAQGKQIINTFTGQLEPQWLKRSYR
jgi:hypothetical protein